MPDELTPKSEDQPVVSPWVWILVALVFAGLLAAPLGLIYLTPSRLRFATALGEVYNIITSTFLACSFIALIYAVLLQRRELQLQREQLHLLRDTVAKLADVQAKASEAIAAQAKDLLLSAQLNAIQSRAAAYDQQMQMLQAQPKGSEGEQLLLRFRQHRDALHEQLDNALAEVRNANRGSA